MKREDCERKIAEYMSAIRLTLLEYNADAKYLSLSLSIGSNGNDDGEWDCWSYSGSNDYYNKEQEYPIHFGGHLDIKDEKYWDCVSEEEDKETTNQLAYEGKLLPDGSSFNSWRTM